MLDGIKHFAENRKFAINALEHTSGRDSFILQVCQTNVALLCNEVRKKTMTEHIPSDILSMIKVYCYGTVQFIFEWLMEDMPLSVEELVKIFEKSLPPPLKQYLYED